MAPPAMGETPTKGGEAAAGGSSSSNGASNGEQRPPLPPYAPLEAEADDDVSWAGNGRSSGSGGATPLRVTMEGLDPLPSTASAAAAAGGPVLLAAGAAGEGGEERPEGEGEGEEAPEGLRVSISALSLSSAAEHQERTQPPLPATPQKAHALAPGKTTTSDGTTLLIHSTEHDGTGLVSSPTTAGSSEHSLIPIPAFPKEEEVVEAGGGGGGVIKRSRSNASSGYRTPAKPLDMEEGGGNSGSGMHLLSPRSLMMECPPSPLHSDVDAGDVRSSVSQMLEDFLHLPKWQFRLMIGIIIFLFSSLVILIILSTLYGFMLNMSHVKVTSVELALPFPHVDKQGNVPVTSTLLLSNSNPFPVKTGTTHVDIFADKNMTQSVGHATVPPMTLHAHEDEHQITFNYSIPHVMNLPGGADLVRHVLNKEASFFYTVSRIPVKVRALGLVPMTRHLKVNCEILRDWAHEGVLLSDCASRFV